MTQLEHQHTVAVYVAASKARVLVDQLGGTPDEARAEALAIAEEIGHCIQTRPAQVITRLVRTDEITTLDNIPLTP